MLTFWEILIITQEPFIEATLSIRVYAMYSRNIWVLILLLALACIIMPLAVVGIVKAGPAQNLAAPGLDGCNTPYPRPMADRLAQTVQFRLVCDVLVFMLTVRQAYVQGHASRLYAGSLIQRMLHDGSMYFGVIVLATIANIVTFYILLSGFLSWFTSSLSLTLLCRLMLNLHEAAAARVDTVELNTLDLMSIRFAGTTTGLTTVDEGY
ncbi:hypothetical protein B0H13DRAFT_2337254 [Mycena leptocephala]|nr:hypothetical protein B0H13DRAFT_2337254 [Mycena leptocephala]